MQINPGSMAEKSGLHVGDVILKIGNADTAPMRHKDAQDAIFSAGNKLKLLLQRYSCDAICHSLGND